MAEFKAVVSEKDPFEYPNISILTTLLLLWACQDSDFKVETKLNISGDKRSSSRERLSIGTLVEKRSRKGCRNKKYEFDKRGVSRLKKFVALPVHHD